MNRYANLLTYLMTSFLLLVSQSCMDSEQIKRVNSASIGIDPNAPIALDISHPAFDEDQQTQITLAYSDPDGDIATSCQISNLSNVKISQGCSCTSGVCKVGIKGISNYNGSANFKYVIKTNEKVSNIASVDLIINPIDDFPVTTNFSPASFSEDLQSVISLNYTDVDPDQATSCNISNLTNVSVTQACACVAGVCTVGVTGSTNYNGPASFTYTVTANAQVSNSSLVSLTIGAANDAPVADNINPAAFNEDTQSIITLSYSDNDSDLATSCSLSGLTNVAITQACSCNGAGVCTVGVTGSANYFGIAGFNYTVTANGQNSNSAAASLNINSMPDAPVAVDITPPAFNEDTQSIITLSYTDADGDLANACTISNLNNVTVSQACACNGAGVCTVGVTGTANYTGSAGFDYTVSANGQTSSAETATLTINPTDDAPVALNITPTAFDEDTNSTITLSYTDVESDVATSCNTSNLSNITVITPCACALGICTVTVRGTSNYHGIASFDYTVTANGQTSNAAASSLTISSVDDKPVVADISPAAFPEDTQSVITLSYTDADSDLATACTISNLSNVTVTQACACNGAGVCTVGVTGTLNYTGAASFDYTVTANGATAAVAETASLTINNADDAPVVADITPPAFNEDTQSVITLSYTDADNDKATACTISNLSNVTVTQACACDGAGVCTVGVTGTANYVGAASFDYTVTANGQTASPAETASLTINNTNDAPVVADITPAAFNEDTQSVITLSYTDADSDLATACTISNLSNVTVTQACACNGAGVCTVGVTGTSHYNGAASFDYTVTANGQTSAVAETASLTISNVDDAPIVADITPAAFPEDTQSIITLSYTDADSDLATACTISNLSNVTVTQACACDGAGVCTVGVTGSANYIGPASFDYTVTANGATAALAETAFLTINNADDAPVVADITPAAFNEDTQSVVTLSYTDTDNDKANACTISNLSNVTVTQACACDGAGVCTVGVTGTANYNGAASFDYTVTANGATAAVAETASLTINNVDDAPVVADITPAAFNEDTQSIITLSYTDADSDLATACTISNLSNVTVTQACACNGAGVCTVGVTGTLNYTGAASFDYTVTANGATAAVAETASLTINNANDAPVVADITPAAFNEDTQSIITLSYTDADNDKATACTISNLNNVTVTQACGCDGAGVCTVGVTGSANYNGAASFDYTVTANGQTSAVAETASLTINNVDDAPVVADITPAAFNEDTQSVITLSYTDADSDLATACTISNLSNVTVTQACACNGAGVCTVGVTGTLNYTGAASFDYTVTANGATAAVAETASLTINNVNDAPVVADITPPAFNEDTQSVITLSYTDADSDLATACTISNLSNITVTQACACDGAGVCTVGVTGTANYVGAASFDYTVTANGQTASPAETASLTINNANDAPVVADISPAAFNEDTQSIITLSYTDADSDLATACTISNLSNITVTQACACNGAGVCTVGVTGTANYNGAASFDYTVTANGQTSAVAETASLTINNVDDAPVVADISPAAFNEDTQSVITLSYTDADSDLATACTISNLSNVTVTQACACDGAGACTVGVTGTLNYNGAASFDYVVTANGATAAVAETASLTINADNDAPVAINLTPGAFDEDTNEVITLSYTDTESDQATTCSTSNLTNVTVVSACSCTLGTCQVTVKGTANYNGVASFDYTVTAAGLTSNAATASLTISAVDDAPVVADISPAAFNENTQSVITLSYTDVESHLATACTISNLSNVTVTQACACDGAGVCTVGVTGTLNYNGSASFDYTVTANGLTASPAETATLTISNVDNAPVVADISPAAFNEDTQSVITLSYTDADNDKATACTISNLTNVTVTQACACDGAGVCTVGVTGTANYVGAASFDYTVTANGATAAVAETASLTINNADDAPVVADISPAAFNEDTQSVITLSYTDSENDKATACTISNLSNVTVTQACACDGAGVCTVGVTGTANYVGAASFDYTVTANGAISAVAETASLTINNVDDAPVVADITPAAFGEDTQSVITLSYTDVDNDKATACTISNLSNVTVTQACACDGAGVCTVGVTGTLNYTGPASFDYTVTANGATAAVAETATLNITNNNDAPVVADITPAAFNEDTQSIITLSYTDPDSDLASACTISNLSNVTVTQACACDGAGVCTVGVTGTANYNGSASFDYTVTANGQTAAPAETASLTINNVDDAPVVADISPAAFPEDTQSIITLSYTDADSDKATACTISNLSNVTVTQACACDGAGVCTVGVTGTANYNGAASFDYTVTANGATAAIAETASLTINADNDAPVAINITPAAFDEDTNEVITLSYTDTESDQATTCSTSNLSNVTVVSACSCTLGTCQVTVKGTANYNGVASFDYTVTAAGLTSNAATASLTISAVDDAPVVADISPAAFNEDTQSVITLSYTDVESHLATACTISNLSNVTVTQACACDGAGVCTVGVTGTSNYTGSASFDYVVTANGLTASPAETASLTINNTDDAPVVADISPAAFNEDTQSVITLSYTDADNDKATACTLSNLTNITVTQACACDGAGVCTVGVTGTSNYVGLASFDYTVTANGQTASPAETASLTINNADDAPVVADISPAAFNEDTQSVITLSYTDSDNDKATTCTISNLSNVTVTQACACDGAGVCTVGVTGTSNYNGSASFDYTVTANGQTSAVAETATLTINNVDDAPVVADISPASFAENTQSIITLSYTDADSDKATACTISNLSNVTETQACACNGAGVCTVGVTGALNYNGAASFDYTVTANGATAAVAETASLTITNTDNAPVVADISPAAFNEDTQSVITLSYTDTDNDKATACSISNLSNITVTQACACDGAGVCTVGVTGTANYVGAASFDYTVTANGATAAVAETASLTINNIDDAPVVADISPAAFNEDTQSVITLSYTDADSDKATACTISNLSNVTVTQACACDGAGVCTVGVTGTLNYTGAASFDYTVTANGATSAVAETASLTINNVDDAPVVADITPAAFNEDTQSIITLSYTDADNDKATACTISNLSNVTVTQACACDGAGVCTVGVTGTSNYVGAASFDYTVTANGQTASPAETASLTINNANDAPVVADISPAAFNEDTQSVITLSYTDADNDKATACTISNLSNVTVTQACACDGAGVCTVGVTGTANYVGAASFDYTVTANGQTSAVAETASLTINNVDDAPVVADISPAAFPEDTQSVITLSYTDADSDKATACTISNLSNVTVTQACACDGAGVCTVGITGTANYNGAASFDYVVTANGATAAVAETASLTINADNDAPVAINITPAAFDEDTNEVITLSYTDTESDQATTCSTSNLTNVTVVSACSCTLGTCQVTVKGTANYNGVASFDYTVTAAGLTSNAATASLTISAVDDAPVVADISPAAFNEDTQSVITLSYTDADSDKATACTVSNLSNVTVTQACACNGAGVCTVGVTGTSNYTGAASFDYTVTANGQTASPAETASLTINNANDAPVVADISPAAFNEDTQSVITLSYTDADNDKATACTISNLSNVTVTQACACDGAGVCTVGVTGTANYNGSASFDYTVTANGQTSAVAETATLSITNVDDAPVVADISPAAFNEDTQSIITLSYTDADSDKGTACTISNLSNVTITQACACDGAGVCTVGVTGTSNYTGAASFDYTVTANGQTASPAETASLTINNANDAPVVADISPGAFNEDTQSVITLSYTDADNDKATACTISNLTNVTVTQACACDGAGVCTVGVTGTANYVGSASFDYTVTANGQTASPAETASLTISNVDDAPVVADISPAAFNEDTQSVITLSYTDADSDKATACTISNLSNVTVTQACACDGAGVCTVGVTGTSNYTGAASFDYTVTANGQTASPAETASLTINNANDAPVVADISPAAFNEDTQSVITLSYTDADNDKATACTISNLSNVTVTQACACDGAGVCTVGVTGTANYNGSASFDYTVTANGQAAAVAETASLTINNVDDAPVVADITPAAFNKNTQSIITLSYTDVENDKATACTISNLSSVTVTQACGCDGAGVCTVGVTGTLNYTGAASFDYTVTANGATAALAETASLTINNTNSAPVVADISPAAFNEDTQSVITLSYTDADSDLATACTISNLSNVTVTQACACDGAGVCTVGVTGTANYNGSASFDYTVTANGQTSAVAETASLTINNVDDAPVAANITPAAFNQDTQSVITLSYTDAESNQATACSTSSLTNVTVTQACACAAGVCTVGVTGTSGYSGAASFAYTVTANSQSSNSATASLTINPAGAPSDTAPVAIEINPDALTINTQSIVYLNYTDADSDQATACTISNLANVTVTQPCSCNSGICTVGVTGTNNYLGSASFDYTVTANSAVSNTTQAILRVVPVASVTAKLVELFPSQDLILPSDAVIWDTVSDVSSAYKIFHNADPVYTIKTNTTNSNFSISPSGLLSLISMSGLVTNSTYSLTIRAEDLYANLYDEKTVTVKIIDSASINYVDPTYAGTVEDGSRNQPYKTWEKAKTNWTTNEYLLQKRGTIHYLYNFAVDKANITLGAYGSGARPIIYSKNNVAVITTGTTTGINIRDLYIKNDQQWTDVISLNANTSGNQIKIMNSKITGGTKALSLSSTANILILNNEISYQRNMAISISTSMTNVNISHNYIHHFGQVFHSDQYAVAHNGINISPNSESASSITYNIIDKSDTGIGACIGSNKQVTSVKFNYCKASNASFKASNASHISYGINFSASTSNASSFEISGNKFVDVEIGLIIKSFSAVKIYSNEIYNTTTAVRYALNSGGQLYNNLFKGVFSSAVLFIDTSTIGVTSKNNIFDIGAGIPAYSGASTRLTASDFNLFAHGAIMSGYASLAAWQGAGFDASSSVGTPTYYETATLDFHLVTGSSGISAGTNLSLIKDIEGQNYANPPHIGPYQTTKGTMTGNAPVANNISASFNEESETIITLSYTDPDSDLATSCSIFGLASINITQPCTCSAGTCTVGIEGDLDFSGITNFSYYVEANSRKSNTATATITVNPIDDAPIAVNFTAYSFNEDTESSITLEFIDSEFDPGTSCAISNLSNVTITQPCTCDGYFCYVYIKGTNNYFGAAKFDFTVTANSVTSNIGTASFTINNVNDAPIANNITPAAFDEDVASVITLSYTDPDFDFASSCTLSNVTSVSITSACTCILGTCSVTVKGAANYSGIASFDYTVTVNGQTTNLATASLTISNVADAPVANNLTPPYLYANSQSIITLSYSDQENDLASACSLSSLNNVSITQACACSGGTCTVGVTSAATGSASFSYNVTANSQTSNNATSSMFVLEAGAPLASNITPPAFNENAQSIITLSYTDPENDSATSCSLSNLSHITITQACACSGGVCTVGVTGTNNYYGPAGFTYTVTANAQTSNSAAATLTINAGTVAMRLVTLLPAQSLILASDAVVGEVVSDVSSKYYLFHNSTGVTYSITSNTANNNFTISSAGVVSVSTMTGLVAGTTYNVTVRAEDSTLKIYDEKVMSIKVVSSTDIVYIDPTYSGSRASTRVKPQITWAQGIAAAANGKYLLQKRGTTATTTALAIQSFSNLTIGAYGTGAAPILNLSNASYLINTGNAFTMRDIVVNATSASYSGPVLYLAAQTGGIKIFNSKITCPSGTLSISASDLSNGLQVINNQISGKIYGNSNPNYNDNFEISYNYLTETGNSIEFQGYMKTLDVHHNIIKPTTGKCMSLSASDQLAVASFRYNLCDHGGTTYPVVYYTNTADATSSSNYLQVVGNKIIGDNDLLSVTNYRVKIHSNEFLMSTTENSKAAIELGTKARGEVYNNLFVGGAASDIGLLITNNWTESLKVKNNVFDMLTASWAMYWAPGNSGPEESDYNLFSHDDNNFIDGYIDLADWQTTGKDLNSIVGTPLYYDDTVLDFSLVPSSPAFGVGTDLLLIKDIEEVNYNGSEVHLGPYQYVK